MWVDWVVTTFVVGALVYGVSAIIFKRHIRLSMVDNGDFRSSAALLHTQFGRARLRLDRKLIEAKRLDVFSRLERRNRIIAQLEAEKEQDFRVSEEGTPLTTIEILRQRRLRREESLASSEGIN